MSFISRLRSVVAGDDYLDSDFDDLDYPGDDYEDDQGRPSSIGSELAPSTGSPFGDGFSYLLDKVFGS